MTRLKIILFFLLSQQYLNPHIISKAVRWGNTSLLTPVLDPEPVTRTSAIFVPNFIFLKRKERKKSWS